VSDVRPGTAVRDSTVAVLAGIVLCAGLVTYSGLAAAALDGAAAVTGITVVAAAGSAVMTRAGRWSGPADRVTLARTVLIGGCATIAVLVLTGALPARPWWLLALAVPALVLDGVDGKVARRTGTSSDAGARLDMEMDAALLLILSLVATRSIGWWVLGIGLMRYAFVAASWVRPHLHDPLPFSSFRRLTAAVQGVTLAVALAPVVPLWLSRTAVALALAMLVVSFARDIAYLERTGRSSSAGSGADPGTPAPPAV
jgi:phosphatidylglycerophosphate synthase